MAYRSQPGSDPPLQPRVYSSTPGSRVRWGRIALLVSALIPVIALAVGGGYYLWFRHVVEGANSRVDPGVSEALGSSPATSLTVPASPGAMDILLLG